VLLKERNMLATERAAARTARDRFLNPLRLGKVRRQRGRASRASDTALTRLHLRRRAAQVRKSMARIKLVLTERAIEEHKQTGDVQKLAEAKARINQL
jgi:hypothetical protein